MRKRPGIRAVNQPLPQSDKKEVEPESSENKNPDRVGSQENLGVYEVSEVGEGPKGHLKQLLDACDE